MKYIQFQFIITLGSGHEEFAQRDIGDIKIMHICTSCKKCISISAHVQKMHINYAIMNKVCYETQMPPYEANSSGGLPSSSKYQISTSFVIIFLFEACSINSKILI
jgi:hypothetical protein